MELYRKHRPKLFKQMVGQETAIKTLQKLLSKQALPHCMILSGPSGCGKTTAARILREKLNGIPIKDDRNFVEINAASERGIEMARSIEDRSGLAAMGDGVRIWLIDEAHQMTSQCQNAILKLLEDTPKHVYFFLCTTEPGKLLTTIQTRATEIRFSSLGPDEIEILLRKVSTKEGKTITEDLIQKIIEVCSGSARKALVLYQQVIELDDDDQVAAVLRSTQNTDVIKICRVLVNPRVKWPEVAKVLKEIKMDDPESLRWMILGYFKSILLGGGKLAPRACMIIQCFRDHLYDSKAAGFVANCYEVVHYK